ncbi:MAG TPA: ABC transporter ATP-binding protein [Virgibacillus sp.]|nr:ABC transporter ATP-binding protein [Virgibacillus sp.]
MLNVYGLTKKYRKQTVLNEVSFSINRGDIIGLVGENGAGKSTLLQILATLSEPTAGTIALDDLSYDRHKQAIRKQIGFVPQDIAIWDTFTVEENMLFFEKLSWVSKNNETLRQLCLDMKLDRWKENVKTLSGGMKRKLNIAITLIHDPSILLLDEPTVGIDLKSRKEIGEYLYRLAKDTGKTIIYTSHDMDEIIHLCDNVLCIGSDPFYTEILKSAGKKVKVI